MSTRRTIQKITPNRPEYFDAQYWPVLVALVVLSGITAGAILTLLNGVWMWGSLLALAIMVPITMLALERIGNERLRRALQLAIVISMSLHMMIIVYASLTDIFGKERTKISKPTKRRPQRVILVSQSNQPRILEKVTQHEIKETEVELEKKPTTEKSQPVEIPVEVDPVNTDRQITRSAKRSQSVPRFDESLSQLSSSTNSKRQNDTQKRPQTSQQVSTSSSSPSENSESSSAAPNDAIASSQKSQRQPTSAAAPELASDTATSAPRVNSSARRRRSESNTPATESPSQSTARIRRTTTSLPRTSANAPVKSESTASRANAESAPKDITEPVTQRERRSVAEKRPLQDLPKPQNSESQAVTKSSTRRTQSTPAPPSIAQPTSNPVNPRRSRRSAELATSPRAVESPSAAITRSKSGESRLQPTASSVNLERSTAVGSGASQNVSSNSGSVPSTAIRASDTARRQRTTSSTEAQPSLTSLEKSNARRSVTNRRKVESALKANTTNPSKLTGSSQPSTTTATASAATVDSASQAHRAEISAQKGESQIDIGATKVITESTAQKRSGGGQPSVANLEMEEVIRQRQSSGSRAPTLDAATGTETVANNLPNSQPASSNSNSPAESAVVANRLRGSEALSGAPTETMRVGPKSDNVSSEIEGILADNRRKRSESTSDSANAPEDNDEEEQRGNAQTRLAQAPRTNSAVNLGSNEAEPGTSEGAVSRTMGPASSEVATDGKASSSLAPTAGRSRLKASTVDDLATNGSATRRSSKRSEPGTGEIESPNSEPRNSNRRGSGLGLSTKATQIAGGSSKAGPNRTGDANVATESKVEVDRGNRSGTIELQVAADDGAAGLAIDPSTRVGIKARPATVDSNSIEAEIDTRFKRDDAGGAPTLSRDAVAAKEAFRGRMENQSGGGPKTEAAIELGLEFLARHQHTDGSWSLGEFDKTSQLHRQQLDSDAAATGLAVIAFQGAGYNHREFKYANQLDLAIDWLIANQDSDGCLYVASNKKSDDVCRMYTHGIATLALAEAYGMTQDPKLVDPIKAAISYMSDTQDAEHGGWRYFANIDKRNTDTSVTGWMLMAMQSARLSGFEVPTDTFEKIEDWLDVANGVDNESLFRYRPHGKDTELYDRSEGRKVSPTMTSVGLLMRLYMGWDRADVRFQRGVDYLAKYPPSDQTMTQRDTYYWYYATQVMRHYGGKRWENWNAKLHPLLIDSQMQNGPMAGSWHPYLPVPDRWGHAGGRLYVTTMNLLSLEVDYRLLPLYEETTK